MDCNHDCKSCPSLTQFDGETSCKLLNEEIYAIRAKKEAYKKMAEYFERKGEKNDG
jgi:hypothetical protein